MNNFENGGTKPFRILSLDGGGAKGFYSLGVLREVEGLVGKPLSETFDLVYGTSTGAIIAALIAQGYSVDDIYCLYRDNVPIIMKQKDARGRTRALAKLSSEVFGEKMFDSFKTRVGIVTTKWLIERPMIFKNNIDQTHGRRGTFTSGFGVNISDAVQASCSAFPFFERKIVRTDNKDEIELVDGGYCANNPTLYAIADATRALNTDANNLRVLNIGVGNYPDPKVSWFNGMRYARHLLSVQLLQKTLEINTQSMDQLRHVLFQHVRTIRISDTFERPEMATNLLENNLSKLNLLRQRGVESFASREADIINLMTR